MNVKKLFNYNIDFYLAGLFMCVFSSIFLVGRPYLSLIIILGCFIFYNWYYTRPLFSSIFFISFNAFIITVFIFVESNVLIIVLFAIKLLIFLLVIGIFVSLYNKKMVYFLKESFFY